MQKKASKQQLNSESNCKKVEKSDQGHISNNMKKHLTNKRTGQTTRIPIILLASLISLILLLQGCASDKSETTDQVDQDAILRVGLTLDAAPQLLKINKDNSTQGLEIDLITMFAKSKNYLLETSTYTPEELLFALRRGEIDIAIPASTDTYISDNFLQPCAAHLKTGQRILVNSAVSMFINNKDQLDNDKVTILTPVGSTSAIFAKKVIPNAHHISLKDLQSCIKKALTDNGNVIMLNADKAWVLNSRTFVLNANSKKQEKLNSTLKIVLPPLTDEQISWAVRRDDQQRKKALNDFIEQLKKSGKLQEMIELNNADIINE